MAKLSTYTELDPAAVDASERLFGFSTGANFTVSFPSLFAIALAALVLPDAVDESGLPGSNLSITAGNGDGVDGTYGGNVTLLAGDGSSAGGRGGNVIISGGDGNEARGGWLTLQSGPATVGNSPGGEVGIESGHGIGSGAGGGITVQAGIPGETGDAGWVAINSAAGGITSGNGGVIALQTGAATEGDGGDFMVTLGAGGGAGRNGLMIVAGFPTADPLVVGAVWLNTGVFTVSAGP